MRPFTKIAALLFGIGALIHVYRLISPFDIVIANNTIPQGASIAVVLIAIAFCAGLWREAKR